MNSETKIVLPTKPIPAKTQNPSRLILYGPPKVGKTTFLSQLEGNLIIDLEEGTNSIEALKYNVNSLAELKLLGRAIIDAGRPYNYISLDTGTKLEEWCEWDATDLYMASVVGKNFNRDKNGNPIPRELWESVLTLPNGGGYLWLRQSYFRWLDNLAKLAPHFIIVCHLKDKVIEKAGKEVSAKDLDLTGKIKAITCANADAIGYIYRQEVNDKSMLRINFASSDSVICGARPLHLQGKDIEADWSHIFIE